MESRKLIQFGNNSHVVTLPISWLKSNKLKKGDLIYFNENGNRELVLSPEMNNKKVTKEITINIDGKTSDEIRRELTSAYINSNNTIQIIGKDLGEQGENVKRYIHDLIALEVMEEDKNKIITKDFLDMEKISINNLIRKMDTINRSMLIDSKNMFNEDLYESIYHRDHDINRLCFLIMRTVKYALTNPSAIDLFKTTHQGLLRYWQLTDHLEKVADESKRIARLIRRVKLNDKGIKDLVKIYDKAEIFYLGAMKAYYKEDKNLAIKLAKNKGELIKMCDIYLSRNHDKKWIPNIIEKLKVMIIEIHNIIRITYQ